MTRYYLTAEMEYDRNATNFELESEKERTGRWQSVGKGSQVITNFWDDVIVQNCYLYGDYDHCIDAWGRYNKHYDGPNVKFLGGTNGYGTEDDEV